MRCFDIRRPYPPPEFGVKQGPCPLTIKGRHGMKGCNRLRNFRPRGLRMPDHPREPKEITRDTVLGGEALKPGYNWSREIPAHGHSAVDFEERVNFRRLHDYRLARARQALAGSQLGSVLCFDNNNIRYLTSTVIGEWSRDKMCRFALLTGNGEPWLWDFGSAAVHHRLYAPWLPRDHCPPGMVGLRRSEEHTSELQSPCNLVCRLLLEKKKELSMP